MEWCVYCVWLNCGGVDGGGRDRALLMLWKRVGVDRDYYLSTSSYVK